MLSYVVQTALSAARHIQEVRLSFKAKLALLFAPLALIPSIASAAVDAAVTTALSTALTDVGTVGSAVFVVIVAAVAFKLLRRVL
ncbi:MAG: hypothetical protein IPN87_18870 [Saprospiraceae bacterium]|nr:hypothetical protein [Candidatus Brachybacter algidus]